MNNYDITQEQNTRPHSVTDDFKYAEVEFDGYVPDDFIHAPAPDLFFEYRIIDPVTGGPVIDPTSHLVAARTVGYSVEYEGEYYWTYNVYSEVAPGIEPLYTSTIDKWSQVNTALLLPCTHLGDIDIGITGLDTDLYYGDVEVEGYIKSNVSTIGIKDYDPETGDYTVVKRPPIFVGFGKHTNLFANDEYVAPEDIEFWLEIPEEDEYEDERTISIRRLLLFYEANFNPVDGWDFKPYPSAEGRLYFRFTLDSEIINGENTDLEFKVYEKLPYTTKSVDISEESTWNGEYIWTHGEDRSYRLMIPTGENTTFKFSFDNIDKPKVVDVPYYWTEDGSMKSEKFTFEKEFENEYIYPDKVTKDLLRVNYSSGTVTDIPDNTVDASAKITLSNGFEYNLPINKRYEDNDLIVYIDQDMYYNYDEEKVMLGESTKYKVEDGIVLPWDSITKGKIEFHMTISTYRDYDFYFEMDIGNSKVLRGDEGKYQVMEVK